MQCFLKYIEEEYIASDLCCMHTVKASWHASTIVHPLYHYPQTFASHTAFSPKTEELFIQPECSDISNNVSPNRSTYLCGDKRSGCHFLKLWDELHYESHRCISSGLSGVARCVHEPGVSSLQEQWDNIYHSALGGQDMVCAWCLHELERMPPASNPAFKQLWHLSASFVQMNLSRQLFNV